jgi:hypothetical protein
LIVAAEGDDLKLEATQGEAGHVEKAGEPIGNEGAVNALDQLALDELIFEVAHTVKPNAEIKTACLVVGAELTAEADVCQKLDSVFVHAAKRCDLLTFCENILVITVEIVAVDLKDVVKQADAVLVLIDSIIAFKQGCSTLLGVGKFIEKPCKIRSHSLVLS